MGNHQTRSRVNAKKIPVESKTPAPQLASATRLGIGAIVLFTAAALSLLSFFGVAGVLGRWINEGLTLLFGWGHFIIPILLVVSGYILLVPERGRLSPTTTLGLVLMILAYSGLLHLFVPVDRAITTIDTGYGGGYVGVVLSFPLQKIMGVWATLVVLIGLLIISMLVVFNTTLKQLAEPGSAIARFYERLRRLAEKIRWRWRPIPPGQSADADRTAAGEESFAARTIAPEKFLPGQRTVEPEQLEILPRSKHQRPRAANMSVSLLDANQSQPTSGNIEENKRIIAHTLANFGITVEMGEVSVGPTVTQYTLKPAEGVKLAQIMTLQNDLALALAAHPIRIEAPIPGKSLVGIEVPNQSVAVVSLREVLESDEFKKHPSPLAFALGKDVAGKPWVVDLDSMPHLLIAGATGSGKSVGINSMIVSLLFHNSPERLKFIMIDPKRVELSVYNDIPHLLTPVITTVDKTVNALRWVVAEMDRRYQRLQDVGKRDIHVYHQAGGEDMPFIIVVIDELADLMAVAAKDVEGAITRLAQMARAVGIHLVVATQRPSVDVITGLIKANITARIAYNVVSIVDARTILDTGGAEKLLGRGDMLFIAASLSKPKRLQGAYLSDKEIERVVKALQEGGEPAYENDVITKTAPPPTGALVDSVGDELLGEAEAVIRQAGKASASLLQRRLRIGYARAARLLDLLEERGIIGPGEGAKPREILAPPTDQSVAPARSPTRPPRRGESGWGFGESGRPTDETVDEQADDSPDSPGHQTGRQVE